MAKYKFKSRLNRPAPTAPAPQRNRQAERKERAFTPFRASTSPPPGTYDPALDAQLRAGGRGLFDLEQDTSLMNERELDDYLLGQQELQRQRDEGLADLVRARTQSRENYDSDLGALTRNYQRLGNSQDQSAAVAGVSSGGALVQAAQKRAANQEVDKKPIDTNYNRFVEQAGIDEQRLQEGFGRGMGQLATGYERGYTDRNLVQLPRAQREQSFFGQDIGEQRFFQAKQGGFVPPTKPVNEKTRAGLTFQVQGMKKPPAQRKYTLPTGRQLGRKQFVKTIQGRRA